MIFNPFEPNAGPMGGEGLAWPPCALQLHGTSYFFCHIKTSFICEFEGYLPIRVEASLSNFPQFDLPA
jgi:hypothetical protein